MHLWIIKITYNRTATNFMDDRFVNLVEEVILTLLWQSGSSESATVCFVSDECLWCSANRNALGQLANQSRLCLLEGGTLKKREAVLREAGHRGPTVMYSILKIMCFLNIKACQDVLGGGMKRAVFRSEPVSEAKQCDAQLDIPLCGRALRSVAHGQSNALLMFHSRSPVNQIPLRSRTDITFIL